MPIVVNLFYTVVLLDQKELKCDAELNCRPLGPRIISNKLFTNIYICDLGRRGCNVVLQISLWPMGAMVCTPSILGKVYVNIRLFASHTRKKLSQSACDALVRRNYIPIRGQI